MRIKPTIMTSEGMKQKCPRCDEFKLLDEYHNSKHTANGRQYYCKPCQNELSKIKREHRKTHGPTVIVDAKVCAKCKNKKPVSQFPIKRDAADGYVSYCKPCWLIITRKAQQRQRQKGTGL